MNILLFIDSLGSGGAQRQLVELAIGFKERGHNVSFLTYHPLNFFKEQLDNKDIGVTTLVENSPFKRIYKIRRFIRGSNYDVVLSFLQTPSLIAELSSFPNRKWKLIVGERSANPQILRSVKLKLMRLLHLFADYVVSNSYMNMLMVRKINPLLNKRKCKVIYNVLDLEKWSVNFDTLFQSQGRVRLLVISSHQKLKNLDGLIEGVNNLTTDEKGKLSIDWFGETLDDSLFEGKKKIDSYSLNDIFSFHSPTLQIHNIMKDYDAVGLFSFYEGLPNVICEGMGSGKLVIASDISDNSKLLRSKDFIVDPHDPKTITSVLRKLIASDKEFTRSIGMRNRSIAEELFNRDKIINEYLELMY